MARIVQNKNKSSNHKENIIKKEITDSEDEEEMENEDDENAINAEDSEAEPDDDDEDEDDDEEVDEDDDDGDDDDDDDDEDDDDGDDDDDDEAEEHDQKKLESKTKIQKSKEELVAEEIKSKYQSIHGKQMFVLFPARLPDNEDELQAKVKALSPLIIKAHRPRQKYARFCVVDFETQEQRNKTLKHLEKAVKTDDKLKGIVVSQPRTESPKFVEQLITKRLESLDKKRAKALMRKANKSSMRNKHLTSSIVIINLPKNATDIEVRKLFPNAVDVQLKTNKNKKQQHSVAAITMPTPIDAYAAAKKKLSLHGTQLKINFNTQRNNMKETKKNIRAEALDSGDNEAKKFTPKSKTPKAQQNKGLNVANVKQSKAPSSQNGNSSSNSKVKVAVKRKANNEIQSAASNAKQTNYIKNKAPIAKKPKHNIKKVKNVK